MAKRALIRKGDRTTHGGEVLTGDETFTIHGRAVARVGDLVSCPRCRGTHRIATGAPTMFSAQLVGRHDDITDCGAKLIASQCTDTYDDGGEAPATLGSRPEPEAALGTSGSADVDESTYTVDEVDHDEPRALRFQALDPVSGKSLAKRPYVLTRDSGVQHGGLTDAQGYTQTIEALATEQVAVHFMFSDADGQTIDREDLLP